MRYVISRSFSAVVSSGLLCISKRESEQIKKFKSEEKLVNFWFFNPFTMCEEESVEYLRDLIKEKDSIDKEDEHSVLKKILSQGN